ncbi:MAG: hypothetical protein QG621_153 [Patescibacteria group bacterium]|jgi:hypothetical protein|nr:hypothetical protein [Patescibacteria group bacterium]
MLIRLYASYDEEPWGEYGPDTQNLSLSGSLELGHFTERDEEEALADLKILHQFTSPGRDLQAHVVLGAKEDNKVTVPIDGFWVSIVDPAVTPTPFTALGGFVLWSNRGSRIIPWSIRLSEVLKPTISKT